MPFQDLAHSVAPPLILPTPANQLKSKIITALCFTICLNSSICFLPGVKYPMQPVLVTAATLQVCAAFHLCVARHFSECPPAGAVPRSISGLRNGGRQSLLGEPVPKIRPVSSQNFQIPGILRTKILATTQKPLQGCAQPLKPSHSLCDRLSQFVFNTMNTRDG